MKNLLFTIFLTFGFAQITYGSELPHVSDVKIVVDMGPELAAVQPTATVYFTISSCGARDLKVTSKKTDELVYITISDLDEADCRAMPVDREYSFQVSSDATLESYVVLNPIAPIIK